MVLAEQVSFENIKEREDWGYEHKNLLLNQLSGIDVPRVLLKHDFVDSSSIPKDGWEMLLKGMYNMPLDFKIPESVLNIELDCHIGKENGDSSSKRSARTCVSRSLHLSVPNNYYVYGQPSDVLLTRGPHADCIPNDGRGIVDNGNTILALGEMMGCCVTDLDFEQRCGLLSLDAQGVDFKHLALKAYLLLQQTILAHTSDAFTMEANPIPMLITHMSVGEVLKSCMSKKLVVDCSSMSNEQVRLAYSLAQEWPFRRAIDDNGDHDIYSTLLLDAEEAVFYTSKGDQIRDELNGDFGNPDDLFALIMQLFLHFNAAKDLLEVFSNAKGLCSLLSYLPKPRDDIVPTLHLKYALSRGVNRLLKKGDHLTHMAETSQFQSSSAHMVLDMVMGLQSYNRLHCIGERLGLYNDSIFSGQMDSSRVLGMLRDHGYAFTGKLNTIHEAIAPWMKCISMTGNMLSDWLLDHSAAVRKVRYEGGDFVNGWVPAPMLLMYNTDVIALSSDELIKKPMSITPRTILSAYVRQDDLQLVKDTTVWSQIVGLDSTGIGLSGLSWACTPYPPNPNSSLRKGWIGLNGTYSAKWVTITVPSATPTQSYRDARLAHFFRGHYLVSADVSASRALARSSSLTRIHRSSTGLRARNVVTPPSEPSATEETSADTVSDTDAIVIPDHSVISIAGDGNCGPEAVAASISAVTNKNVSSNTLVNALGWTDVALGTHWTDEGLALLASAAGCNLTVINETDKSATSYALRDSAPKVYVMYTGDGTHGHYSGIHPRSSSPMHKYPGLTITDVDPNSARRCLQSMHARNASSSSGERSSKSREVSVEQSRLLQNISSEISALGLQHECHGGCSPSHTQHNLVDNSAGTQRSTNVTLSSHRTGSSSDSSKSSTDRRPRLPRGKSPCKTAQCPGALPPLIHSHSIVPVFPPLPSPIARTKSPLRQSGYTKPAKK